MTSGKMMSKQLICSPFNSPSKERGKNETVISFILVLFISITFNKICFAETKSSYNELQTLLSPFTNIQSIKLPFQEKRFSLFLKQARESHGFIEYSQPDLFIKQIIKPANKKFIIKNDQLTIISDNATTQKFSLDDYPQFKQFQALFSGLLQGKASELTRYYNYEITKLSDNNTHLILKSQIVDQFTQNTINNSSSKQIDIIFADQLIKKITITGFGGERSEMSFDNAIFIKHLPEDL